MSAKAQEIYLELSDTLADIEGLLDNIAFDQLTDQYEQLFIEADQSLRLARYHLKKAEEISN